QVELEPADGGGSKIYQRVAVRGPTVDRAALLDVDQLACLPSGGVHEIDRKMFETRISHFGSVGRDLRSNILGDEHGLPPRDAVPNPQFATGRVELAISKNTATRGGCRQGLAAAGVGDRLQRT